MRFPNGYGSIINLGKKRRKPFAVRITTGVEEIENKEGLKSYRQKYKYLGYFEKRKDALDFLAKYNADPSIIENNITFKELYEEWASYRFPKVNKTTATHYKMWFNMCSSLHNMPFKDIRANHLQKIIDDNKEKRSLFQLKSFLGQLYKYAAKYDIDKKYSDFIELPAKVNKIPKVPFTKEEIERLWANQHIEYVDVYLILLYTGMRVSELLGMKIEHINLKERYMFIENSKTAAGVRYVPIHKDIMPLIEARYDVNKVYLYRNKRNNSKLNYANFVSSYAPVVKEKLQINHTIHETRHTFISQCNRLQLNDLVVKRIVGHANANITQHYTSVNVDDLLKLIDAFYY